MNRKSVISDPNIIPRVKQYLENNVDKSYVDVTEMAKTLMEQYSDYNRRKLVPFRILVERAYKHVLHSYGLDSNHGTDDEDEDDEEGDVEVMTGAMGIDSMSDALTSMYKNKCRATTATNDGELIDISSDDDDETEIPDQDPTKKKVTNGCAKTNDAVSCRRLIVDNNGVVTSKTLTTVPLVNTTKKRRLSNEGLSNYFGQTVTKQAGSSSKLKKFKREHLIHKSNNTFKDVGGMDKILKDLCELIMHIQHPEIYKHIGLPPPRGFLLHGPPGSGKTLLARAIAGQLNVLLYEVPATELVAGISGESEERIREIFDQAADLAPCVLFIDEIDSISSNRINAQKDMERRIVAQLLSSLDNLSRAEYGNQVLVIGATNRPDALDPALRRVGRFDHEICLGIPDRISRSQILEKISNKLKLERPFDFDEMAKLTPGYVGADLLALATKAASTAVKRVIADNQKLNTIDPNVIVNLDDSNAMDTTTNSTAVESEKTINEPEKESKCDDVPMEEPKDVNDTQKDVNDTAKETEAPVKSKDKEIETVIAEVEESQKVQDVKPSEPTLESMVKLLSQESKPLSKKELEKLCITRDDFMEALKYVQPSAKREGFITVPDVSWDDIGSLQDIRNELKLAILAPVKFPEKLKKLGLQSPSGVMLCGPPGCGKTLLAKAVANEAGINFISVKGPELLNMYVGESERAVRQCFQRARNSAPCVIFFDEFDSLCPKRSDSGDNGSSMRVVNQLLTEMDGIEDRKGVFIMAATNRPDIVDPAVLRPGRLDKILYVGLPEKADRIDILIALTKNKTKPLFESDVDIEELAEMTSGYTGADLAGLVRHASLQTLKDSITDIVDPTDELKVSRKNFLDAFNNIKPSVSEKDIKHYKILKEKYGQTKNAV